MTTKLERTMFVTSRQHEFFTENELTMQIGAPKALWVPVIAKELIDNALDACESTDVAPEIVITLKKDSLTVADNGPGLQASTITKALDYSVRVSDKRHYISPTRGQLGNALKCIFPAAFVATGRKSAVEITACGIHHRIEVDVDRIAQEPRIEHVQTPSVQNGTTVVIHWPDVACSESRHYDSEMYQGTVERILPELVQDFACLNPHASFVVTAGGKQRTFKASDPDWRKWRASDPTSAHWYTKMELCELIAAEISEEERRSLPRKTLRDFVGGFDGLSRPQYRQRVLQESRLAGLYLFNLRADIDRGGELVGRLLAAMQHVSKPVNPKRLGIIGRENMQAALEGYGVDYEIDFKNYGQDAQIGEDGLPFAVESAFGMTEANRPRKLIFGLNHSVVFRVPSPNLYTILSDCRLGIEEPVAVIVHQSCPRFAFTGHGKGSV